MIDICIVTRLAECKFFNLIDSIVLKTSKDTYGNMNFYVAYTGDSDLQMQHIEEKLKLTGRHFKVIKMPYNFAKCNNAIVRLGNADKLLFINDDVELIDDVITHMSEIIDSSDSIGTVGCKLLYGNNTIQHLGIQLHIKRDSYKFIGVTHLGLNQKDIEVPDFYAIGNTGALLMTRREDFFRAGMFDEGYQHCFEDCQLNFLMLADGKMNVCCGSVAAYHYESVTRKQSICKEDIVKIIAFYEENKHKIISSKANMSNTIVERN